MMLWMDSSGCRRKPNIWHKSLPPTRMFSTSSSTCRRESFREYSTSYRVRRSIMASLSYMGINIMVLPEISLASTIFRMYAPAFMGENLGRIKPVTTSAHSFREEMSMGIC